MKILLINPQRNRKDQFGSFASHVPLNVPFGIGFLAGYLLKKGKDVVVIDEEVTPVTYNVLAEYIKAEKPVCYNEFNQVYGLRGNVWWNNIKNLISKKI